MKHKMTDQKPSRNPNEHRQKSGPMPFLGKGNGKGNGNSNGNDNGNDSGNENGSSSRVSGVPSFYVRCNPLVSGSKFRFPEFSISTLGRQCWHGSVAVARNNSATRYDTLCSRR